jgi:hypothetical protein
MPTYKPTVGQVQNLKTIVSQEFSSPAKEKIETLLALYGKELDDHHLNVITSLSNHTGGKVPIKAWVAGIRGV